MRRLWIAVAVLMFTTVGHAGKVEAEGDEQFYTGNELLALCESDAAVERMLCAGFVAGVNDMNITYDIWGIQSKLFCKPEDATLGQLRKVIIKGLSEKPESLHMAATSRIVNYLSEVFPCD